MTNLAIGIEFKTAAKGVGDVTEVAGQIEDFGREVLQLPVKWGQKLRGVVISREGPH